MRSHGTVRKGVSAALWAVAFLSAVAAHAAIPAGERQVLLNLYASTNGAGWTNRTNWNGAAGTECTWFGVTCNPEGTSVTGVILDNNNLTGTLPALGGLPNLQEFRVYSNGLTGSIPSFAGMSQLRYFEASLNQLTGTLPDLTGAPNLDTFAAYTNGLTGSYPAAVRKRPAADVHGFEQSADRAAAGARGARVADGLRRLQQPFDRDDSRAHRRAPAQDVHRGDGTS